MQDEIDSAIKLECIEGLWKNHNQNDILLININGESVAIQISAGEIISQEIISDLQDRIKHLVHSGSFASTHYAISHLALYYAYLSKEDAEKILTALQENSQIHWICDDTDVKQFMLNLFNDWKEYLPRELIAWIKGAYDEETPNASE